MRKKYEAKLANLKEEIANLEKVQNGDRSIKKGVIKDFDSLESKKEQLKMIDRFAEQKALYQGGIEKLEKENKKLDSSIKIKNKAIERRKTKLEEINNGRNEQKAKLREISNERAARLSERAGIRLEISRLEVEAKIIMEEREKLEKQIKEANSKEEEAELKEKLASKELEQDSNNALFLEKNDKLNEFSNLENDEQEQQWQKKEAAIEKEIAKFDKSEVKVNDEIAEFNNTISDIKSKKKSIGNATNDLNSKISRCDLAITSILNGKKWNEIEQKIDGFENKTYTADEKATEKAVDESTIEKDKNLEEIIDILREMQLDEKNNDKSKNAYDDEEMEEAKEDNRKKLSEDDIENILNNAYDDEERKKFSEILPNLKLDGNTGTIQFYSDENGITYVYDKNTGDFYEQDGIQANIEKLERERKTQDSQEFENQEYDDQEQDIEGVVDNLAREAKQEEYEQDEEEYEQDEEEYEQDEEEYEQDEEEYEQDEEEYEQDEEKHEQEEKNLPAEVKEKWYVRFKNWLGAKINNIFFKGKDKEEVDYKDKMPKQMPNEGEYSDKTEKNINPILNKNDKQEDINQEMDEEELNEEENARNLKIPDVLLKTVNVGEDKTKTEPQGKTQVQEEPQSHVDVIEENDAYIKKILGTGDEVTDDLLTSNSTSKKWRDNFYKTSQAGIEQRRKEIADQKAKEEAELAEQKAKEAEERRMEEERAKEQAEQDDLNKGVAEALRRQEAARKRDEEEDAKRRKSEELKAKYQEYLARKREGMDR